MRPTHLSLRRPLLAALVLSASFAVPARAANKDMIQLQTQVQQLQEAVARLQQSNDERMGVMKDLVQQTADAVNRMSVTVGGLQQHMTTQQEASLAKTDQVSGQIQSLNDSMDELKARMGKLERVMQNIDNQQQQAAAAMQNQAPAGSAASGSSLPVPQQSSAAPGGPASQEMASAPAPIVPGRRSAASPAAAGLPAASAPAAGGSGAAEMYRSALGDYMAGKYALAASEFADLVKQYPDENVSGNAYFYLGEINNKAIKPSIAVKDYDHLIEHYPDNAKIPAAHLHKGETLISMKQPDAGVRELRALIQRFPNSPEAGQARSKLNAMGVAIVPRAAR